MDEFRLGGVQSGLAVLCHMVSLIAMFLGFFPFCVRQRGAPKELVKGRKTQAQNWGKSFDCFDVALSRFFLLKRSPN